MENLSELWDKLPLIDRCYIAETANAIHRANWQWHEMDENMQNEMIAADKKNLIDK